MTTFALSTLRTRAQQESDNVNSGFVSSTGSAPIEWTALINASYQELYGLLVTTFGADYYVASPFSITTDGINDKFALPTDFFKLLGVDLQVQASSLWTTLKEFAFAERNRFGLVNSPVPMSGQTLRLWYAPVITPLNADADLTVDIVNGWEEYIIVDAAMKAISKEEGDVSVLMARKQALLARINGEAANRDAGSPAHIVDYYAAQPPAMRYRLHGSKLWLTGGNTPALPYGEGWDFGGSWW